MTSIKVSNNTKRNFPEGTATDDRREAKDNMEIKLLVQVTETFTNVVLRERGTRQQGGGGVVE